VLRTNHNRPHYHFIPTNQNSTTQPNTTFHSTTHRTIYTRTYTYNLYTHSTTKQTNTSFRIRQRSPKNIRSNHLSRPNHIHPPLRHRTQHHHRHLATLGTSQHWPIGLAHQTLHLLHGLHNRRGKRIDRLSGGSIRYTGVGYSDQCLVSVFGGESGVFEGGGGGGGGEGV